MAEKQNVTLFGAGGKMGIRCSRNLQKSVYRVSYIEKSDKGIAALEEIGITTSAAEEVLPQTDIAVLAIPDTLIGPVAAEIVPRLKKGAMVMVLDPAAPYSGKLPQNDDVAYFVTHPCHPPIVGDEMDPAAQQDFFGGVKAKQNIVCALMQGTEEHYREGEALAGTMFAPVMRAHRISVEQMAFLEPIMAETVTLTLMATIREALDETIKMGVPEQAAWDFMLGHMKVNLGILFNFLDASVSDGARKAMARGREKLLKPDWKKVFDKDFLLGEVKAITQAQEDSDFPGVHEHSRSKEAPG